jgi:aryl-alcohol dehydrogenase-like predicted oxidoreductase
VLSGAATADQLASNLAATGDMLPPAALEELAELAEPPTDYWAARSRRPWA